MDEWVEQETRHGIRYEKDDVECDASGDEEEGKEHCLLKGPLVRVGHETKCHDMHTIGRLVATALLAVTSAVAALLLVATAVATYETSVSDVIM